MTMLLSRPCHEGCVVHGIKAYLDSKYGKARDRALGWDYLNLTSAEIKQGWDVVMDETRSLYGHDQFGRGDGTKKCRFYYHFLISPNPADDKSLHELRELTLRWCKEMFGGGEDPGRLGSYQVAICYHDDNTNHVPHAHIIVNCTNLDNGRKLQMNKHMGEKIMPERLQAIAKEMGYSFFDNTPEEKVRRIRSTQESRLTKFEIGLQNELKWSWKQEFRDKINIAKVLTNDGDEFVEYMQKLGVAVKPSKDKRDWVFTDDRNERWSVRGELLGRPYQRDRIESYVSGLRGKLFISKQNRANAADRAAEWIKAAEENGIGRSFEITDVVECTKLLKKYDIEVYEDFAVAYDRIGVDRAVAGYTRSDTNNPYYFELKKLQSAEQLAREMHLLDGALPRISQETRDRLRKAIQKVNDEMAAEAAEQRVDASVQRGRNRWETEEETRINRRTSSGGRGRNNQRQAQSQSEQQRRGKSI